jgi:hypothetical protein
MILTGESSKVSSARTQTSLAGLPNNCLEHDPEKVEAGFSEKIMLHQDARAKLERVLAQCRL